MEMVSTCFYDNLENLLNKKLVSMDDLNTKVANILRVKFKMNLFENYYTDPSRQKIILDPKHKEAAKAQATQCPVLLQNKNKTLPISKTVGTLAVIGQLADDPENQIGCWAPDGKAQDSITPLTSLKAALPSSKIIYAQGYKDTRSTDTSYFNEAIAAASQADRVLLFLGEDNGLSGESNARAYINLPGVQEELVRQIAKTGKPIAAVIYAGRSLLLEPILPYVDSVLFAWHLGTMAGPALTDLLLGNVSPSGKLPVTFLRAAGQIPLYYNKKNTGRPNDTHEYQPYTSSYIDIDSTPLFPFGFGLSYSSFSYSNLKLSKNAISFGESMIVSATVKN
jgi:beta-glucosidase